MPAQRINLRDVRQEILSRCEALRDHGGLAGSYRSAPRRRPDLYASLDVAIMRTVMGEDLLLLPADERAEWAIHINAFAHRDLDGGGDGTYEDRLGHSPLHANGMVVGALGVLGGKQAFPVRLYDDFAAADAVVPWLDGLDWRNQWRGSHNFWGGLHVFSFSRRATDEWRSAVFGALDARLDRDTGWWRKGVPHADRHQPLGGSVHILPIYEHHGRDFPVPERLIDSTLALQLSDGRWLDRPGTPPMHYLELDALYALKFAMGLAPGYRKADIDRAIDRYAALVLESWRADREALLAQHPHLILAVVGTFGLLQQHRPEEFVDEVTWTDIFSDRRLYRTAEVEA